MSGLIHDVFVVIAAATAWVVGAGLLGTTVIVVPAVLLARTAHKRWRVRQAARSAPSSEQQGQP